MTFFPLDSWQITHLLKCKYFFIFFSRSNNSSFSIAVFIYFFIFDSILTKTTHKAGVTLRLFNESGSVDEPHQPNECSVTPVNKPHQPNECSVTPVNKPHQPNECSEASVNKA